MRFALIGTPISHSLSPELFRAAYPGSAHTYELLETNTIEEAMRLFLEGGFNGVNVTAPYKEGVLKYADKIDLLVELIGASNLLINDNGVISAFNTDFYGVQESIRGYVSHGEKALVLGCGGAGKAAALAAKSAGCEVTIINRSPDKARDFSIKAGLGFNTINFLKDEVMSCDLFINTISEPIEVLKTIDYSGKKILEANYRSPHLSFTEKKSGATYISGKSWLLYQAVQSFLLFTTTQPNLESMRFMINNI